MLKHKTHWNVKSDDLDDFHTTLLTKMNNKLIPRFPTWRFHQITKQPYKFECLLINTKVCKLHARDFHGAQLISITSRFPYTHRHVYTYAAHSFFLSAGPVQIHLVFVKTCIMIIKPSTLYASPSSDQQYDLTQIRSDPKYDPHTDALPPYTQTQPILPSAPGVKGLSPPSTM